MNDTPRIKAREDRGTWEVVFWRTVDGRRKRIRESCKTKSAAQDRQKELIGERKLAGEAWSTLPANQRADLMLVADEIHREGYTVRQVWEAFQKGPTATSTPKRVIALDKAIEEYLVDMKVRNKSDKYIKSLKQYLTQFARGRSKKPVHEIKAADLKNWFAGRNEASTTRQSNMGRLTSFFDYCLREKYLTENPCKLIGSIRIIQDPPQILTPMQYARLLIGTARKHPRFLAWVICGQVAGLRPEETTHAGKKYDSDEVRAKKVAKKVGWKDVDLVKGFIRVPRTASKPRHSRIVHLEPSATEWLKFAKDNGAELPVSENTKKRHLKRLRKLIRETKWPADVLRHTAASVLLAKYQDAARVAEELGNSPATLLKNYKEPMHKEVAEKLLAIVPSRLKKRTKKKASAKKKMPSAKDLQPAAGKIIRLPTAGRTATALAR